MSAHLGDADLGDPAVEYWTRAMASVRAEDRRRRVALPLALHVSAAIGAAAAGYVGGHLVRVLARGHHRS